MEEAHRLKREMSGMWFYKVFALFQSKKQREIYKRFAGTVLFERT